MYRDGFRTQETFKMEFFMTVANNLKSLVIITKDSTTDATVVLDRPTM